MKDTKYCYEHFSLYDFQGIARHLEAMAAKGWLLDKIGSFLWRYRRMEPRQLHFAVTYLPQHSTLEAEPTPAQQELDALCAQAGWWKVASNGQMQIYCTDEPDPVPLENDPAIQVANIHSAMRKSLLPSHILLAFLAVFQLGFQAYQFFTDPLLYLCNSGYLLSVPAWLSVLAMSLAELAYYGHWHRNARSAAEDGILLAPSGHGWLFRVFNGFTLTLAVLLLCSAFLGEYLDLYLMVLGWVACVLLSGIGAQKLIKKLGLTDKASRAIFSGVLTLLVLLCGMVVTRVITVELPARQDNHVYMEHNGSQYYLARDEIPLKTQDLLTVDPDWQSYSSNSLGSFLVQWQYCRQRDFSHNTNTHPYLSYAIYDSTLPWILDMAVEELQKELTGGYELVYSESWDALAVYRESHNITNAVSYVIRWDGRVAYMHLSFGPDELTQAQIDTIVSVLKP